MEYNLKGYVFDCMPTLAYTYKNTVYFELKMNVHRLNKRRYKTRWQNKTRRDKTRDGTSQNKTKWEPDEMREDEMWHNVNTHLKVKDKIRLKL